MPMAERPIYELLAGGAYFAWLPAPPSVATSLLYWPQELVADAAGYPSGTPGVHERDSEVFEVTGVAGCKRCSPRSGYAGNLHVAKINRSPLQPAFSRHRGGLPRCRLIESQNTAAKNDRCRMSERRLQPIAPSASW